MPADSLAEELIRALGTALVRNGALSEMDMYDAAKLAEMDGRDDVAHALRCMVIEAQPVTEG